MQWNAINACFEAVGAVLALRNLLSGLRAGPAIGRGVYWPMLAFSAVWACECIPYYVSHHDVWSCAGAAVRCAALLAWVGLAVRP